MGLAGLALDIEKKPSIKNAILKAKKKSNPPFITQDRQPPPTAANRRPVAIYGLSQMATDGLPDLMEAKTEGGGGGEGGAAAAPPPAPRRGELRRSSRKRPPAISMDAAAADGICDVESQEELSDRQLEALLREHEEDGEFSELPFELNEWVESLVPAYT